MMHFLLPNFHGLPECLPVRKHWDKPWRFGNARIMNHRESKDSLSFCHLRHYQICQTLRLERMLTPRL